MSGPHGIPETFEIEKLVTTETMSSETCAYVEWSGWSGVWDEPTITN